MNALIDREGGAPAPSASAPVADAPSSNSSSTKTPTTGKVTEEQIDDRGAEFPRVNDAVIGKKHRYGYEMSMGNAGFGQVDEGAILKYDRQAGTCAEIKLGKGRTCGEVVFAPAENAKTEDDGYLMTYIYDQHKDASEFVIVDAKSMSSDFIATVQLPRIPFGFHGSWVPATVAN